MLSNKKFYLLLVISIIGGILYTIYSFISVEKLKNSPNYIQQEQSIQQQINKVKKERMLLIKTFQTNPNISTLQYYMSLVKQFKYLVNGSMQIQSFSLKFMNHSKQINSTQLKKSKNINLLSKYLTNYKGNKYIKSLSLITNFKLSINKNTNIDNSTINFFKLYKPLIYLYYLKENKPIIIKNINFSNNTYNIYMQILGQ